MNFSVELTYAVPGLNDPLVDQLMEVAHDDKATNVKVEGMSAHLSDELLGIDVWAPNCANPGEAVHAAWVVGERVMAGVECVLLGVEAIPSVDEVECD